MTRAATVPALLSLLVLVLVLPGVALAEGETKTFEEHNFKITLPSSSWSWMELNSQEIDSGYVTSLGRRAQGTIAVVKIRVVPTNDLPLSELTQEVKDGLSSSLVQVDGVKVTRGKLSGINGTLAIIKGKDNRDCHRMYRAYAIEADGRFHQLIFDLRDGAETKQAREIDALRRGYRLLKGAGPEEEAPDEDIHGGDEDDSDDADGGESGGAPTREGRTLVFPSHNLKWTLPEGSPFRWTSITPDEGIKEGMLCRAEAQIERPPKENAKDQGPRVNAARVILSVAPQGEGWTPEGCVKSPGVHANIEENVFDKVDYGRMKIVEELPVGDHTGAALQMVGTKDGRVRYFRLYAVGLKGERYVWEVLLEGDGSVDDDFKRPVKNLLDGVEFIDKTTWIRGPLAVPGVPSHDRERGSDVGKAKDVQSMGFKVTKPEEMAIISFKPENTGGNLRLAWEMRTEDKQAYFYFDVQTWSERSLQRQRNPYEEMVRQREGQWKEHAGSPDTIAKGKTAWFKSKFGRGKGLGYEFTGYLDDAPFIEYGFIVKYKKYVYWIRFQFGGENAEKIFSKTFRALKKALKFVT